MIKLNPNIHRPFPKIILSLQGYEQQDVLQLRDLLPFGVNNRLVTGNNLGATNVLPRDSSSHLLLENDLLSPNISDT